MAGIYPPGSRMPSDRKLEEELRVSRLTIAKALSLLEQSQFLVRKPRSGTYVCAECPSEANLDDESGVFRYITLPTTVDGVVMVKDCIDEGLYRALRDSNYRLSVEYFNTIEENIKLLRTHDSSLSRGMVIWPSDNLKMIEILGYYKRDNFPFVLVDSHFPELPCDRVCINNKLGAELMVDYLYQLGHRRIAYLTVQSGSTSINDRLGGFFLAMNRRNLNALRFLGVVPDNDRISSASHGAKNCSFIEDYIVNIMGQKDRPTAIFCSNDFIAMTVMQMLKEHNYHIPRDISVVGFDNIEKGMWVKPHLTTVSPEFQQMGFEAGKILLGRCRKKLPNMPLIVEVEPRLIVRDSAVPPEN